MRCTQTTKVSGMRVACPTSSSSMITVRLPELLAGAIVKPADPRHWVDGVAVAARFSLSQRHCGRDARVLLRHRDG